MALFSGLFRSRPREQESRPPLPPRPTHRATPTVISTPIEITGLSNGGDLEGELGDDGETTVYDGFESLCKRYEQQALDLQSLRLAHQTAVSTIQQLHSELAQTVKERQQAIEARQAEVGTLFAQLGDAAAQIKQLRSETDQSIATLRAELRQQQKNFANKQNEHRTREKKLKEENLVSSKALARLNQALEEQRILCEQVAQRAQEAPRLPKGILRSSLATRFVSPFVVVLIDGDAYKFSRELTRDRLHGGARAAHRMKTEVLNYIATHEDIPLHSKIVARVFFNAGSHRGKLGKDGLESAATRHTFMIQFSETHPLFDFLDCGSGKERADTKIRQNFELFIDNPYCRAMFLAVCYDGGFVRMLEPYQHSEDALTKIVLIKAGQIAPAFLAVPRFRFTEFTSVFNELYSLKIGPIGKTLCAAAEMPTASMPTEGILFSNDVSEPEDLPIGHVPYAPWKPARHYVLSTTTLVGLVYDANLLGAKGWRAPPKPELVALCVSSSHLRASDDSTKASPAVKVKRPIRSRIKDLESVIRQKQEAAEQPGISARVKKKLRRTARSLEGEVAQLRQEVALKTRSTSHTA